jgi:hypothetical protein
MQVLLQKLDQETEGSALSVPEQVLLNAEIILRQSA